MPITYLDEEGPSRITYLDGPVGVNKLPGLPPLPMEEFMARSAPRPQSFWSQPVADFQAAVPKIPSFGTGIVRKLSEAAGGVEESILDGLSQMTAPANVAALPLFMVPYVGPALGLGLGAKLLGSGAGQALSGRTFPYLGEPRDVGAGLGEMGLGALATAPFAKAVYKGGTRPVPTEETRFQQARNVTPHIEYLEPEGGQNATTIRSHQATLPQQRLLTEGGERPRGGDIQRLGGGTPGPGGTALPPPQAPKEVAAKPVFEVAEAPKKEHLYLEAPDVLRTQSGFRTETKVPGQQLWNRMRNLASQGKFSPTEFEHLNEMGLKEFLAEARTPEEVAKWVEGQGKSVEVVKRGHRAKEVSPEEAEFATLTHEWLDTHSERESLNSLLRVKKILANATANAYAYADAYTYADADAYADANVDVYADAYARYRKLLLDVKTPEQHLEARQTISKEILAKEQETRQKFIERFGDKAKRYFELYDKYGNKPQEETKAHWQSFSPKPESEMPGYVELAVVKLNQNQLEIERLSKQQMALDQSTAMGQTEAHMLQSKINNLARAAEPKFPSSHYFPPNTLGFGRAYEEVLKEDYPSEGLKKGDKILLGIEGQTDIIVNHQDGTYSVAGHPEFGKTNKAGTLRNAAKLEPLVADWERLVTKALLEHAKSVGAKAFGWIDAETAMTMEGHDLQAIRYNIWENPEGHQVALDRNDPPPPNNGPWELQPQDISQEKGMRLHYDTLLPKIAGELTGSKPQKMAFGEHKMAFDEQVNRPAGNQIQARSPGGLLSAIDPTQVERYRNLGWEIIGGQEKQPRKDLIFREPTGEPKTSVTANVFSLENVKDKVFSLAGKDVYKAPAKPVESRPWTSIVYKGKGGSHIRGVNYYGEGEYYATDKEFAAMFGDFVETRTITLKNPFFGTDKEIRGMGSPSEITKKLQAKGYDGIVVGVGKGQEVVVFKPIERTVKPSAKEKVQKEEEKGLLKQKESLLPAVVPRQGLPTRTGSAPPAEPPSRGGPPAIPPSGGEPPSGGQVPMRIRRERSRVERFTEALRNFWQGRHLHYDTIPAMMDAANNEARITAKQVANDVKDRLKTAVGHEPTKDERTALSFVIEAKGDIANLATFHRQIAPLNKANVERAIDVAKRDWAKLQPVAKFYEEANRFQVVEKENKFGVATDFRQGYVPHVADLTDVNAVLFELSGAGASGGFTKQRVHDTFAEGLAAGVKYRSLDAVDLMEHRLAAGNSRVNMNQFVDSLKEVNDPGTGKPIIRDLVVRKKELPSGEAKSETLTPPGYVSMFLGTKPVAVHKGYVGLLEALTQPSLFSRNIVGRMLMEAISTAKHTTLLFDLYHPIRLFFYSAPLRGWKAFSSYKPGLWLLDYNEPTLRRMAERGEIPKEFLDTFIENKKIKDLSVTTGFNVGRINDALYTTFVRKLPGLGGYNKWLFDEFQRGLMMETYISEFRRVKAARPEQSDIQNARYVSKNLNVRFGNMMNQSWVKSKTMTDMLRFTFLAPQWNEGLFRSELGATLQLGELARETITKRRLVPGTLLKDVGTILGAYFIVNQFINFLSRGKPTWENEDDYPGASISAWIPDVAGKSEGFFLNPMALSAEVSHQIIERAEKRKSTLEGIKDVVQYKLSSLGRMMNVLWSGEDWRKNHLDDWERIKEAAKEGLPVPIQAPAVVDIIRGKEAYPGAAQKSIMGGLGVRVDVKHSSLEERTKGMSLQERAATQRSRASITDEATKQAGARKAVEHSFETRKEIQKALPEDIKAFIGANKLSVSGYQNELTIGGTKVPLTDQESAFFRDAVIKHYTERLHALMQRPGFASENERVRQQILSRYLESARKAAQIELRRAIEDGKIGQKKEKFSIRNGFKE